MKDCLIVILFKDTCYILRRIITNINFNCSISVKDKVQFNKPDWKERNLHNEDISYI